MKILHVNMTMDSIYGGGTVERVYQLHHALSKIPETQSHILTLDTGFAYPAYLRGQEMTCLPCWNKRWYLPFLSLATFRLIKQWVVWADVIHLTNHWTLINGAIYLIAKHLKKPYLVCPAGALTIYGRSKFLKKCYQVIIGTQLLKNTSAGIAITADEKNSLTENGIALEKIHHIPNGVNEENFSFTDGALFRQAIHLQNAPYILFLGRLNPIKGPDLLLEAFIKIQHLIPHHLVFVGPDGGLEHELKQKSQNAKISERVHFAGFAGGHLKSSAYYGADLLVVPSRHEAMSIVALEAAITGTPVLLTEQCGFSELVNAGAALEVPVTSFDLAAGIEKLLSSSTQLKKMGEQGKHYARQNYTWKIMAEKYLAVFETVKL